MTLNDYRMLRYEDFFLAVIKRNLNWEEAENVLITLPHLSSPVSALELLKMSVEAALKENNVPLTDENKKRIEEKVKQAITPNLEERYPVILVKHETGYIDLSKMQKLEPEYQIVCQVPLKKYYKESDYSFEEDKDGPYFNIHMEPFKLFVKDYERGKFNLN